MGPTFDRAVVIGGSLAGLFSAATLARHFGEVLVLERDPLEAPFRARKGVPQGRHVHNLLARGDEVIGGLLPGLFEAVWPSPSRTANGWSRCSATTANPPPADDEGWRAFARSLAQPDMATLIDRSEPVTDIVRIRFPHSQWRHHERVAQPDRFVALGDAVCSFNPIYGQGMTSAALQAEALGQAVASATSPRRVLVAGR